MIRKTLGALAALACLAAPASAAVNTFDFTGSPSIANEMSFTGDNGLNVTVTGYELLYIGLDFLPDQVSQNSAGLGVHGYPQDDNELDGDLFTTEALVFEFDWVVSAQSIALSLFNTETESFLWWTFPEAADAFNIYSFSNGSWSLFDGNLAENPYDFNGGLGTQKFAIAAHDANSDFRVAGLTVSAIPEPATWLMMIMGFGLVGIASRRRSVAAAA
ncbi:PEPxxWA-CTERM sorting domain-containing protein [Gimibacter soli]|uniref:PEPxxWA-CTERM sorting domain-containing protein n=1 Tax=Gimibacter soli TaxID=3024400 RepID=A0AAE9XTX1_9PROT|nr:PEPxxWA-CTERM sorting domain-containing protein [Gimibacter soli]WCL54801.1 PEPxxWA-CTERM sorting domain-containing protein [Gimibacter soli]